jgi:hypothetical protein
MHKNFFLSYRDAEVLDHSQTPCSSEDFIPKGGGHSYVFYIQQKQNADYETWNNVARCLKLWDLDVRGFHKQTWRFWFHENRIFVVGMSSPYAQYKPTDTNPIFIEKKKKD